MDKVKFKWQQRGINKIVVRILHDELRAQLKKSPLCQKQQNLMWILLILRRIYLTKDNSDFGH